MKKQNLKNNKGITLIALVITIVVLLILAIVSINLVMNGGIIAHAENAVGKYEIEEEKEKITLAVSESYMSGLGSIKEENLKTALDTNIGAGKYSIDSSNSEYFKVTLTESGREYKVHKNGKVEGPIQGTGSEGGTGTDEVLGVATVGNKVEKNSTINGEKYSSTNPIIPAGFTAINTSTSEWDAEDGPEVDKGLVISDDSGNEFVWVPVTEDISTTEYIVTIEYDTYKEPVVVTGSDGTRLDADETNLQKAECQDIDKDGKLETSDFETELKNMYKTMAESVNKYNGFYVGRFETSRNGANPQTKRSSSVSGSGEIIEPAYYNTSTNENNWYELYALNKRYNTSSVQGNMMWGIQYDKMMTWMGSAANISISGYNKERTCGTAPDDVIKNVYDLYGNSYEWTLETRFSSQDRSSHRGGCYLWEEIPNQRIYSSASLSRGCMASRLALYIL